jgi:hypothetical protein
LITNKVDWRMWVGSVAKRVKLVLTSRYWHSWSKAGILHDTGVGNSSPGQKVNYNAYDLWKAFLL